MKIIFKYSFIILLFSFFGCNSDNNNFIDEPAQNPQVLAYINATVNGEVVETKISSLNTSNYELNINYTQQTNNNNQCINLNYEPGLNPTQDVTLPKFNIGFIGFLDQATQSCSDELSIFESLFSVNNYNYTQDANGQGVSIKYFENSNSSGSVYTSFGAQDASSYFTVTDVEIKNCSLKKCVNITGTFAATLYNASNNSETLPITNGSFKLKIESVN